jgi:hypothetical protein
MRHTTERKETETERGGEGGDEAHRHTRYASAFHFDVTEREYFILALLPFLFLFEAIGRGISLPPSLSLLQLNFPDRME